jgi:hypothetical protein
MTANPSFSSRAVTRPVEAGSSVTCAACGTPVKFTAKTRVWQVIANVYVDGVWARVEHYHADCYTEVGQPYGSAA